MAAIVYPCPVDLKLVVNRIIAAQNSRFGLNDTGPNLVLGFNRWKSVLEAALQESIVAVFSVAHRRSGCGSKGLGFTWGIEEEHGD